MQAGWFLSMNYTRHLKLFPRARVVRPRGVPVGGGAACRVRPGTGGIGIIGRLENSLNRLLKKRKPGLKAPNKDQIERDVPGIARVGVAVSPEGFLLQVRLVERHRIFVFGKGAHHQSGLGRGGFPRLDVAAEQAQVE